MKRVTKLVVAAVAVPTIGALMAPTAVEAATKYLSTTKTVSGRGVVSCPAGYKVTGGGYSVPADKFSDTAVEQYLVSASYPTSTGWRVAATRTRTTLNENDEIVSSTTPYSATVFALCVG